MNRTQQGALLVFVSALAFGSLPILIKSVYTAAPALDSMSVLTWRFVFAVPTIWLLSMLIRQPGAERLPRGRLFAAGLLFTPNSICAFFALTLLPASTYIMLFYTYPAMVAVLSLFTGDRLTVRGYLALALTLVGIALTIPGLQQGIEQGGMLPQILLDAIANSSSLGAVLALLNAFFYAITLVISGVLLRGQTALLRASAWSISGTLFALGILKTVGSLLEPTVLDQPTQTFSALTTGLHAPTTLDAWSLLAGMGILGTVIAIGALYVGIERLGAARAAILGTIEPFSTLLMAQVLLQERMETLQWVGGALILLSVILLQLPTPKRAAAPPELVSS